MAGLLLSTIPLCNVRFWPKAAIPNGASTPLVLATDLEPTPNLRCLENLVAPDLTPRRDRPAPVQPLYEGDAWAGTAHYRLGGGDIFGGELSVRSCQL